MMVRSMLRAGAWPAVTGPARRTAIRSLALLAPLAAGAVLMLAGALRGPRIQASFSAT